MEALGVWIAVVVGLLVGLGVFEVACLFWSWWAGRRPSKDERIRMTALSMAIDSHSESPGIAQDRCFTARAEVFERYLRTGSGSSAAKPKPIRPGPDE